jgi:hypothetical protein
VRKSDLRVARVLAAAACLTLALAGCGGRTSVQGSFSGVQVGASSASAPAAAGTGQGATLRVGRGLGLAIVVGLIVADVVHWTATKLEQAFAEKRDAPLSPLFPVED